MGIPDVPSNRNIGQDFMGYTSPAYQREYYRTHPASREQNRLRKAIHRKSMIDWIRDYLLAHPCVDCGEKNLVVLEFDHVRGVKQRDVMGLLGSSIKSIEAEIAKCDVVCANCHAKRTAERLNSYRWRWRNL
jgi:hypothetical protein